MDPASTTVSFVAGKRGAQNAFVDGYRYTKNGKQYRCLKRVFEVVESIVFSTAITPL